MANHTTVNTQLPAYTLRPVSPLIPWISDFHLSLFLPIAAYWFMSLTFWYIDKKDLWSQYRIHTPEEFKQRNRVTVGEVLRSVLLQQAVQTALGLLIGYLTSPGDVYGREEYDLAIWASRVHMAHDAVPYILALVGIDATSIVHKFHAYTVSSNLKPNSSKPFAFINPIFITKPNGFAPWELWTAKLIYYLLEPAARFGIAIFFSDSWQYFWHRAMHSNKWLYRTPSPPLSPPPPKQLTPIPTGHLHAHHHKLYVPYAFGAFYNTLAEAFLLDTVGTTLSLMLSGLSIRETMWFGTVSVMKGVDDHCGYRLPWDPLQWGNEQNTGFHDVHHQGWGIKVCDVFGRL
ncbi:hypothetical protein MMC21_007384 [Puttea exsequens]|nr:hypothetical protein [Puttea exsequens]